MKNIYTVCRHNIMRLTTQIFTNLHQLLQCFDVLYKLAILLLTNTLQNPTLYTGKGCSLWLEGKIRNQNTFESTLELKNDP